MLLPSGCWAGRAVKLALAVTAAPVSPARPTLDGQCVAWPPAVNEGETPARTGYPVPDLCCFLLGAWRLTRIGWDGVPGRTMRLRGTASFSACGAGLLFEERGTATIGTYRGEAARRYVFRLRSAAPAEVCFEDQTLFHCLDLTAGVAQVRHDCAAGRYEGRYHVLGRDCWVQSWRVTGPRKRQLITSRFIRTAESDGARQPAHLADDGARPGVPRRWDRRESTQEAKWPTQRPQS